jgi:glutamate N-acetyltransferase/amino-acid N-acetyltransferase
VVLFVPAFGRDVGRKAVLLAMKKCQAVAGGVTAAKGFLAAGVHAGIKANRLDMALVVSELPAVAAGVFTTNRVQAAPVKVCKRLLAGGVARAVVVNSGSANACTGREGLRNAVRMGGFVAEALRVPAETVFMCSTGTIGKPLPMDKIEHGVKLAVQALASDGGPKASEAIMTTDTVPKTAAVEVAVDGRPVRVGGMAKGSGMIAPNMATMLGFLTTDAAVRRPALQACLRQAVEASFNRITVDGDRSTNDTVLLMANGVAGNRPLHPGHRDWKAFAGAVKAVALDLARQIVKDGEGATKFVTVTVKGAASAREADLAARAVAHSLLVKTSWFGMDPNWGRVIAAVGYSGAEVRDDRVDIAFDGVPAVRGGRVAPNFALSQLEAILKRPAFEITVNLRLGRGQSTVYTCDCSYDYVKINASYMT